MDSGLITVEAGGNCKVTNCVFTDNSGGGIASTSEYSHIILENSTVARNLGEYIMEIEKNSTVTVLRTILVHNSQEYSTFLQKLIRKSLFEVTADSYLVINLSQINYNEVTGSGSVFFLQENAILSAHNSIINDNFLKDGSAANCKSQSTFTWINVTFSNNCADSGLLSADCNVNIHESYLTYNQITDSTRGLVASTNDLLQVS